MFFDLIHVPEPNKHLVLFYGAYANRVRQSYREHIRPDDEAKPTPSRRAANKRWAELIYRIYEVDPLTCTRCACQMKVIAFITDPERYAGSNPASAPRCCVLSYSVEARR